MTSYLHRLSATLFYLLGVSFFVCYLLFKNKIGAPVPEWWLSVGDLPLLMTGMLYGGTSLYLSVKKPNGASPILAFIIAVPLLVLFGALVAFNFWDILTP